MTDDITYKYFYGKNYEKALRLKEDEKKTSQRKFHEKIPLRGSLKI